MTSLGLSIKLLERHGWMATNVQRSAGRHSFDAYGFGDVLACKILHGREKRIMLVQACFDQDKNRHIKKMEDESRVGRWLRCGGLVMLHVWGKRVKPRPDVVSGWSLVFELAWVLEIDGKLLRDGKRARLPNMWHDRIKP